MAAERKETTGDSSMICSETQDIGFVSFDDIMARLLDERSCYDDVEEQPQNTPFLKWDDDYWRWLHNKRYDICLISENDIALDMGMQEWAQQRNGIIESINKQFYVIVPVGAAAVIADALGLWKPAMSSIIGKDCPSAGLSGTAPYMLCIPPEALRWYPELEQDLAGIGMRCAFDARKHENMRWLWTSEESNIEKRMLQPHPRRVCVVSSGDTESFGLPEMQHRQGFSVSAGDKVEEVEGARCPDCGERGGLWRRTTSRFGTHEQMHLSCKKCGWTGMWLEMGGEDRIVAEAILNDDGQELVLHEWELGENEEEGK